MAHEWYQEYQLNNSSSLYHCINIFINLRQGENEPKDNFKLRWDNVYETMELAGGGNITRSNQLVKVAGDQASSKEKKVQVDKMKEMCLLLSANQKRYSFLLKQLRDGENVSRDEYPVTNTLSLDILICTEGGIQANTQSSNYEIFRGRRGWQHKESMGNTFTEQKGGTE